MDASFDLSNGYVVLRILCGAYFIPHVVGKITQRQASVGFFTKAGLNPPQAWSYLAMAVEIILAPALIFDIMAEAAAYLARSEERRVGTGGVSTCRSRWA